MRELLYHAYLRYPRAFYDRHATGQVVSRATNDLYPIRYFIGWGMVQGIQSAMMIVGVGDRPRYRERAARALRGARDAADRRPRRGIFAHRLIPISRWCSAARPTSTEAADEAVVGIEMVQAFGREDDVRTRFLGQAEAVRDGVRAGARRGARSSRACSSCPRSRSRPCSSSAAAT